jgi:hypothetical protein
MKKEIELNRWLMDDYVTRVISKSQYIMLHDVAPSKRQVHYQDITNAIDERKRPAQTETRRAEDPKSANEPCQKCK